MRLSVIIPVYNVEEYVLRCLKSIIDIENHGDTEIIVVNDGSRDGSMALVSDFASSHPIITIVNQENRGLGAARNTGLKHAQGEYVYFLDSDDYIDLESFVHLFNTGYGSADVIVGNFVYNTDDVIEKMGIERSRRAAERAQIIILMRDNDTDYPTLDLRDDQTVIRIENKTDFFQFIHSIR